MKRPLAVQIVGAGKAAGKALCIRVPPALFHQARNRSLAQQPYADVDHKQSRAGKFARDLGGRFLEEFNQMLRVFLIAEKDAEMFGILGGGPHAEQHHIGVRKGAHAALEQHIAAGNHRAGTGGGRHDAVQERLLHIEQGLVEPLTVFPAQGRNRHE